jgi:DNA-binding FrmR family transcriptional regulator
MHLIAGVRGAIAGLMAEVVEDHVRTHLVDAEKYPGALNTEAAEQLLEVVRSYLK